MHFLKQACFTIVLTLIALAQAAVVSRPSLILNPKPSDLATTTSPTNNSDHNLQRPPRSPFTWHIHDTSLALLFRSYGQDIDEEDIISCYLAASKYVHDVIQAHGDGPIPPRLQLHWVHQTVEISIHYSTRMTYGDLVSVISGIETFQLTYGYFETLFLVNDNTKGQIGSGAIRFAESSTSSQPDNSTSLNPPVIELSPNVSSAVPLTNPPSPPFIWPIPYDPSLSFNFTVFGRVLATADIMSCYVTAANYIKQVIESHGDIPIPERALLHWTHSMARLTIQHRREMTYGVLADVLGGLAAFQDQYGFTEATFHIIEQGFGQIGSGRIAYRRPTRQTERVTSRLQPLINTNLSSTTSLATPRDPTTVRVRNTPITLTFSSYGRVMSSENYLILMNQITLRVIDELLKSPDGKDALIGEQALDWKWGLALVVLHPWGEMTWGMLGTAIEGITAFGIQWGWLSCDFLIGEDRLGEVANGFVGV